MLTDPSFPAGAFALVLADGDVVSSVSRFLSDYGALIAVIASWIGIAIVYLKKRADWSRKSFLQHVNFSLNDVQDDRLLLRTLVERKAIEVWLSDIAVGQILDAAEKVKEAQPFLSLPKDEDHEYLLRSALNVISQLFAASYMARAIGQAVDVKTFVFGVTAEKYEAVKSHKLRVMLMEKELLLSRFGPDAGDAASSLQTAFPHHKDRIRTLQLMARLYLSKDAKEKRLVNEVEVALPAKSAS